MSTNTSASKRRLIACRFSIVSQIIKILETFVKIEKMNDRSQILSEIFKKHVEFYYRKNCYRRIDSKLIYKIKLTCKIKKYANECRTFLFISKLWVICNFSAKRSNQAVFIFNVNANRLFFNINTVKNTYVCINIIIHSNSWYNKIYVYATKKLIDFDGEWSFDQFIYLLCFPFVFCWHFLIFAPENNSNSYFVAVILDDSAIFLVLKRTKLTKTLERHSIFMRNLSKLTKTQK